MKRSNLPTNQHWVPQYYLRSFAIPGTESAKVPQVWAFSTAEGGGGPFRTAIRNVCAQRYLYSPIDRAGHRYADLEEQLARLEHLASRIWPSLTSRRLDLAHPNIRRCIALVVATLFLRHPRTREIVNQRHPQVLREADTEIAQLKDAAPRFRDMSDNDKHWLFVDVIRRNAMRVADLLITKRWSIVVSDTPQFVTSDDPVHAVSPSGHSTGILLPKALVTFPLSPTRVLMMDDNHWEPSNQYYRMKGKTAAAHTYGQMRNAARFIFSACPIDSALYGMLRTFSPDSLR